MPRGVSGLEGFGDAGLEGIGDCSCKLARSSSGRGRRMTGSAFKAMDVVVACLSYEKGGGLEEGGEKSGRSGLRRMTGSAFKAMDVVVGCVSVT